MKKIILTALILLIPIFANAQMSKKDLKGRISISLYGGPQFPVNGNYSTDVKTTDLLTTGSHYTLGAGYFITKGFGIEGSVSAGYNYYARQYKPAGKDPVMVNFSASLNAIYNFGHMLKKSPIAPFVRIGIGTYELEKFNDGILNPEINEEINNHDTKSFGYNLGIGADYSVRKNFSIGLMLDYISFSPRYENLQSNVSSVSTERSAHGYLIPQLKISYYIQVLK